MAIAVDASKWPVIYVTYPKVLDSADIAPYVETLRTVMWKYPPGTYFAVVSDLRPLEITSVKPKIRALLAEQLTALGKDRAARGGPTLIADARVTASALMRGISTALEWVRGSHHVIRFFETMQEADAWVQEALKVR